MSPRPATLRREETVTKVNDNDQREFEERKREERDRRRRLTDVDLNEPLVEILHLLGDLSTERVISSLRAFPKRRRKRRRNSLPPRCSPSPPQPPAPLAHASAQIPSCPRRASSTSRLLRGLRGEGR